MRFRFQTPLLAVLLAFAFGATEVRAASCASYAVIKSYDKAKNEVEVEFEKGKTTKFFPRPEGTPSDTSKIPGECKSKVTRNKTLAVKPTGGKLSVTQVRSNFEGKMLNDADDANWLPTKLQELIQAKTQVVVVVREMGPGKDAPLGITTLYLPITPEEEAEIKRIEAQAEDV